MELGTASINHSRSGRLIMHITKVHHVTTIDRVASDLGEREDWLHDITDEMEIEDECYGSTASANTALWRSRTTGTKISSSQMNPPCSSAATATNRPRQAMPFGDSYRRGLGRMRALQAGRAPE